MPLNKTPHGFDIWKQAGLLGGYLREMQDTQTVTSAVNHPQAAQAVKQMPQPDVMEAISKLIPFSDSAATAQTPTAAPESSPVMQAASQQMSQRDNVIHINFSMNNTFNSTPDKETISQISAAGQQAADDFESRVASVFESIMRNRQRISYG